MTAAVIAFPRSMKRGAKVKRGPCALIFAFPNHLVGDELRARWAWLHDHATQWEHERVEGAYAEFKEWDATVRISGTLKAHFQGEEFNDSYMRREIPKFCALIEKRTSVKDWLETFGIDWKKHRTPEDALFFVFDRLSQPGPMQSA